MPLSRRSLQALSVISSPMPAGSPMLTASGSGRLGVRLLPHHRILDVGVLTQILEVLLGKDLELLLAQLALGGLALGILRLDDLAAAHGPQLDAALADGGREHLVVVRREQEAARRLGNGAGPAVAEVVEAGAADAAGKGARALAVVELGRAAVSASLRRLAICFSVRGDGEQDAMHAQLDVVLALGRGDEAVDVAARDRDLVAVEAPDHIGPGQRYLDPLAHAGDVRTHLADVLGELRRGHLVALGHAVDDAVDVILRRRRR